MKRGGPLKRTVGLSRHTPLKRGAIKPHKSLKRSKNNSISNLTKEADRLFSLHIRQKYADKEEMVACITCPARKPWRQIQNGHYISRSVKSLRWDERNCFPQCASCNIFKSGNLIAYREFLVKKIGEKEVKKMEASRHRVFKVTRQFLESLIEKYRT